MAHSPHRRYKGHCLMCVHNGKGKIRGLGKIRQAPHRDARRIGKLRRVSRETTDRP